jgi:kynurenine formamidase
MRRTVCFGLLALFGCATAEEKAPAGDSISIDLASARIVDLSYTYDESTLYWPSSPSSFELTELARGRTEGGYFYSSYSFCTPEHGGTHIDAPIHFSETGRTAGEIPLRQVIAPGIVIDMTEEASADRDARLSLERVKEWESRNGVVPEGAIVIVRTGWGRRWSEGALSYFGDDTPGDASNLHFPGYGEEAARYLVGERRVGVLGIDSASVDPGPSRDFIVHQIAAAGNVPNLENVARTEELPETGFWVVALPVPIGKGSGGPVRIAAILPSS